MNESVPADNTYVMADKLPTLYQSGPFPLDGIDPEDCAEVLKYFDAASEGKASITFPAHTLLKMTPYDIHTPAVNHTGETLERTFIKIQFSQQRYNLIGNTINPRLSYENWEWMPRHAEIRNHRNSVRDWKREDKHLFTEVYPYSVDFAQDKPDVEWAESNFRWAKKTQPVFAEPANAGEMLLTKHGGDLITANIAQEGDIKITTKQGDSYFLSAAKFASRYEQKPKADGSYRPLGTPQKVLIITQPVMLRSSWGAMQYVPAGSALTAINATDMYLIHKTNFDAAYTVMNPNLEHLASLQATITATNICAVCQKCSGATADRGC